MLESTKKSVKRRPCQYKYGWCLVNHTTINLKKMVVGDSQIRRHFPAQTMNFASNSPLTFDQDL